MRTSLCLLSAAVLATAAVAGAPETAAAQCQWGCTCMGNACGCNQNGSGSRCDLGGTGCVLTGCDTEKKITFAPDGSVVGVEGWSTAVEGEVRVTAIASVDAEASGSVRWEYVAEGRSVARHCSGLILAHHYEPNVAASLRESVRTLRL